MNYPYNQYQHPNTSINQAQFNSQQQAHSYPNPNEYLQSNPIYNISSSSFDSFLTKTFDSSTLQNLKFHIASLPFTSDKNLTSIGPFSFLAQLIETSFNYQCNSKPEMLCQYKRLYSTIYKWRKVKGDGNCFYRTVIFSFIENIILSSNLQMLQNIIFNIHQCFTDPIVQRNSFMNSSTKIDSSILLNCMILIYVALKKNQLETAYEIFIKSINNYPNVDLGLVLYLRYVIYKFIRENQGKMYSKEFGVVIGNLLPSQYETSKGEFLFEEFYEKYLMKMNQDTEKIVIYITPYALGTKLDILLFDCDYENNHNEFGFVGENWLDRDYSILLISRKEHYELGYCKNYYSKYKEVLKRYKADVYQNIILVEIDNENQERNDIDLLNFDRNILQQQGVNGNGNGNDLLVLNNSGNDGNMIKHSQTFMPMMNQQQQHQQHQYMSTYNHQRSNSNPHNHLNQFPYQSNIFISNSKCLKCSINSSTTQINPFFSLCYKCFYNDLQLQITYNYLKCLTSFKSFFKTNKNVSEYNKMFTSMFNSLKMSISNKKDCLIDQTIQIFNHNNPNIIYLNTFFTQIKATKCLNCFNEVTASTMNKTSLPCLCVVCSDKCFNEYFSNVNKVEHKRQKDYCCHCGTMYEEYQLIHLALLMFQKGLGQSKEEVLMLHKNKIKGKCMKCQGVCKDEKAVVSCGNVRNEMVNMMGINVFRHLLCRKCYYTVGIGKSFLCAYCRCEHGVIKEIVNDYDDNGEGFI